MSIHPGYSGQEFMPDALERIARCAPRCRTRPHPGRRRDRRSDNIRDVRDAGATLFVAGSAIFAREDLPRAYRRLVQALA